MHPMALTIRGYSESTGELREIYDRMLARPLPPIYRPAHGGAPGIIQAHSLDPLLIPKVFGTSSTLNGASTSVCIERPVTQSFCVPRSKATIPISRVR